jgi:serine/threonine protein kinase/TolB-like protein
MTRESDSDPPPSSLPPAFDLFERPAAELAAPLFAAHAATGQTVSSGELLGPYRIVREVGHGGMAAVYLADDPRHGRQVALKVVHADLAASVGQRRFLQEIEVAARLLHPHILPVFDSGESDGRLWYAMPYVAGETLRHRLAREPRLPITEAVQIAREVAFALDYAHREGVIHRDIKPGNILLADGQALVADFGIARALHPVIAPETRPDHGLTETGVAIGTPAYMSPEQALGTAEVDARTDIYALGCVLYEMLAGAPPFSGPSAQAIMGKRLTEPAPPIRRLRETVPESLERVLLQALAREPADRFQSAAEFARALESPSGSSTRAPTAPPAPTHIAPRRRLQALALALAAFALLAIGIAARDKLRHRSEGAPALDPSLVAVLPFRVSAADSGLASLREGMVDLLHAKLTGEAGLRAADPRAVLSVWHRLKVSGSDDVPAAAALDAGRQLGAGQLLIGSVVAVRDRLVVTASLLDAGSGQSRAQASTEGPADSLGALLDRLSAELLALRAGEARERLTGLGGYSWPVLQAYIAGRAAARDGRYLEATQHYSRTLGFDSTFALAALGQLNVVSMVARFDLGGGDESEPERWERVSRLAWALRDRLSPRDRSLLLAEIGPHYPAYSSLLDVRAAWEAAAAAAPDAAELWASLADLLYHEGALLGVHDRQRVVAAFQRAWMIDSTYAFPLEHLVDLAADAGDTARVRELSRIYLARHPSSELADYIRWRAARALGDRPALEALRGRISQMSLATLQRIVGWSQLLGYDLRDAELAADAMLVRSGTQAEQASAISAQVQLLANRGRAREARRLMASSFRLPPWLRDFYVVAGARFYVGDTAEANAAASRLGRDLMRPLPSDSDTRAIRYEEGCVAAQWRIGQDDTAGVVRMIARLRQLAIGDAGHPGVLLRGDPDSCVLSLEAAVAVLGGSPNARALVERFDSVMQAGSMDVSGETRFGTGSQQPANLDLAHLLQRLGDNPGALSVLRRRLYNYKIPMLWYLPRYLEQEAKLAAATGDRAGAIRAYQHYLTLMADPDSTYLPAVREARTQLAKLVGERD